ncbi:hypothetical protein GO988_15945 [Hymenobacter sp. HMF4947]|uniref:Uncharacterized protein n=1 Tax=Hymenobacter ginkgonis TaxID=2682976 RepID=A0A7K1THF1_9BACT|nr:hypothetical protein [Hymenobacter ginkgonis]MVN77824.1 hypothetical protein [Hymenobacter ginkgonis]
MSVHTLTIDDFMQLTKKQLEFALRLFRQELDRSIRRLIEDEASWASEQVLDELNHLLTLRKVFLVRLQELHEESRQLGLPVPLPYRQSEFNAVA